MYYEYIEVYMNLMGTLGTNIDVISRGGRSKCTFLRFYVWEHLGTFGYIWGTLGYKYLT